VYARRTPRCTPRRLRAPHLQRRSRSGAPILATAMSTTFAARRRRACVSPVHRRRAQPQARLRLARHPRAAVERDCDVNALLHERGEQEASAPSPASWPLRFRTGRERAGALLPTAVRGDLPRSARRRAAVCIWTDVRDSATSASSDGAAA
jgi:hypothetical protein